MGGAVGKAECKDIGKDGELGIAADDGGRAVGEPEGCGCGAEHDKRKCLW